MPTPYDPSWDREQREQEMWEEAQWDARVARRAGRTTSRGRKVGALLLVLLLLWIYVIRYLI